MSHEEESEREKIEGFNCELMALWESYKELRQKFDDLSIRFIKLKKELENKLNGE